MAKVTIRPANQDPKPPPTEAQLLRIDSMIDHPAFDNDLDSLGKRMDSMLKTKGGAGILIGWMKGKIKEYDKEMAAAQVNAIAAQNALNNARALAQAQNRVLYDLRKKLRDE